MTFFSFIKIYLQVLVYIAKVLFNKLEEDLLFGNMIQLLEERMDC